MLCQSKIWENRSELNIENMHKISSECNLSLPVSAILAKRGMTECAKEFLSKDDETYFSPCLLPDIEKAADIIWEKISSAKSQGKRAKIAVVNDYDVDGVTSGVIIKESLDYIGGNAFIITPNRDIDGYGISMRIIEEILNQDCNFIITTDNGISANEQISYAVKKGCTVIVTDHHEVPFIKDSSGQKKQILPDAHAVINPKRYDSEYPFKDICGAMVALKVAEMLIDKISTIHPEERDVLLQKWTELAGIGTVCDVMPLISENRTVVKRALHSIKQGSAYIGIRQLLKVQEIDSTKINSYNIGFGIGPCINACGRMTGSVDASVSLLLERDYLKAEKLAKEIKELNDERKILSAEGEKAALQIVSESPEQGIYIIYIPNSSPHIMGIIAGRIKDATCHPCICLTDSSDGILKGSGRSIAGYNMYECLSKYKDLYIKFGGHEMAVGLSVKKENLDIIRDNLNSDMLGFDKSLFIPKIIVDLFLPMTKITEDMISELSLFEPYGEGNRYPVLASTNVSLFRLSRIGKNGQYIKMYLAENGRKFDAVYFGIADSFDAYISENFGEDTLSNLYKTNDMEIKMDFIYKPSCNIWNGYTTIQYVISDFKA